MVKTGLPWIAGHYYLRQFVDKSMPDIDFRWQRWPAADQFLQNCYLEACALSTRLADFTRQLEVLTGTLLENWVDHVGINGSRITHDALRALGYKPRRGEDLLPGRRVYVHAGADLPNLIVNPSACASEPICMSLAIRVESIASFLQANSLVANIQGYPLGPFRVASFPDNGFEFQVVERRGYHGYELFPSSLARLGQMTPQRARNILEAKELWQTRKRHWQGVDTVGFDQAESLASQMIELVGRDLACELAFEVEREYWQARNHAARAQKQRQDRLGLGWANHDHHTFRCSRRNFYRVIRVLEMFGFQLRESFHAGHHAGWGAQILEHPVTGIVIFADLDLKPEEIETDFAHNSLEPLAKPNTVGLWVALHGDSFLEAGMHHLEAQFSFEKASSGLLDSAGVETMKPFSDFPFLKQAFSKGEIWPVEPWRLDFALRQGWILPDEAEKFRKEGAIGSHLEILQRKEGYKGFNQQAVSAILAEVDPRKVALD
jgi:hypothetical protein